MLDWLSKELLETYCFSNIDEDRTRSKEVIINGRSYIKYGVECATTVVALKYKVFDPSINRHKFVILYGIARQNPGDLIITAEEGKEIAMENALINPVMKVEYMNDLFHNSNLIDSETYSGDYSPVEISPEYMNDPDAFTVNLFMRAYVAGLPVKFVNTKQELKSLNKDLKLYNRKTGMKSNEYYHQYYVDFRNKFMKD